MSDSKMTVGNTCHADMAGAFAPKSDLGARANVDAVKKLSKSMRWPDSRAGLPNPPDVSGMNK